MNISKKTMNGFSLVEILISLAILAIMTSVLLMTGNNKGKQEVQLVTREIGAQLRLLQNEAINGKVIGEDVICRTEMSFDSVTNKYKINYYKEPCNSGDDPIKTDIFVPKQSKINLGTATEGSISFWAPMGKVDLKLGGPNNNGILLESKRDSDQKMAVCVNDAGNIEEFKSDNLNCAGSAMCVSNAGQTCTVTNACGVGNSGHYECNGDCSASTPALPIGYGNSCDSTANSCGDKNSGVIGCTGCNATTPPEPTHAPCTSTANSCGATNQGTMECGGCNATPPALPVGYGNACFSAYNGCNDRSPGTIGCNGLCNAVVPPNPPFLGQPCTWISSCGIVKPGHKLCNNHCSSEGDNSGCGTYLLWTSFGTSGIGPGGSTVYGCGTITWCPMNCIKGQPYWNWCLAWHLGLFLPCQNVCL